MEGQQLDGDALLGELLRLPAEERADRLRAEGAPDEVLPMLVEIARRRVMGNLRSALEATEMLVGLADAAGGGGPRAQARRARAQALTYANRFDEGLSLLRDAVEIAAEAGETIESARARMAMMHGLARLGRHDEAIEAGETARRAFEDAGNPGLTAAADANLGETHRMRNDPTQALERFNRAREAFAAQPLMEAQLDSNRAQALMDLNRFAEAEAVFASALEVFREAGMHRGAAIVEGNLGDLLSRQGRIELALARFEQARRAYEQDGAQGDVARLQAEQAEAYAMAGLDDDACGAYAEAITELERHGLVAEAARAAVGHGLALTRLRRYDDAAAALARAAAAYRQQNHDAGLGRVRLAEGGLARARGDRDTAETALRDALRLLGDRPAETAIVRHALATLVLEQAGGPDAAALDAADALLDASITTARVFDLAPLLADLIQTRADLRVAQGRSAEALEDRREAVRQIERVRGSLQAERFRSAFAGGHSVVYERLVQALLDETDPDRAIANRAEAFHAVELARSRSLLDLVSGAIDFTELTPDETSDPSAAALVRQASTARGELNALYSRVPEIEHADQRQAWFRGWQDRVRTLERRLQRLENRLSATRGVGGVFAPPADLEAVRERLAPGTALLEYFIAGNELLAFVVTGDGATVQRAIASRADVEEQVEQFRFQVERIVAYGATAHDDPVLAADAQRELRDLYDMLLAPVADALGGVERLAVVPHGPLHAVPFPALHDGKQYLLERCEVVIAPSATLLARPVDAAGATGTDEQRRRPLVVGVPDQNAPGIDAEVDAVAAALGDAVVLRGAEATGPAVRAAVRQANLVHLACHGRFSSVSPLSSGLKLADGWLTVREMYGMDFAGAAVVLSGCETGRTEVARGDELTGLVRGLFAGGASSLVLSQWMVHDESAKDLMALTYRFWHNAGAGRAAGLGPALRSAQRTVLGNQANPVFWAPFVLVGRL